MYEEEGMTLKEMIIKLLRENGKAMHVNDIATAAIIKWPHLPDSENLTY